MDYEQIKELPNAIRNPIAVTESNSNENGVKEKSVIVYIKTKNANGDSMISAMRINGDGTFNGRQIEINKLSTVYGDSKVEHDLMKAIKKQVEEGKGLYYWNKAEARSLLSKSWNSSPGRSLEDGLIGSIHDAGSVVNTDFKMQTETKQSKAIQALVWQEQDSERRRNTDGVLSRQ